MSNEPQETADVETASHDYARRFSGAVGEWMLGIQENIVLNILNPTPGSSILDIGGAHGQLAIPLCREHYPVTLLSSPGADKEKFSAAIEKGVCKFQSGNVITAPFPDKSFDTTISFRLLAHCSRWPKLISELCRTAKHSVIVDYPTSQSFNRIAPALFKAKRKIEGNTRAFRLFTHKEISGEFEKHGFHINRLEKEFFLPMVLHRTLKCKGLSALMENFFKITGFTRLWGSPVIVEMTRKAEEKYK
ncbi:class I SAM-dependent methyltransferase [Verrucomicrobiota bacterium]